MAAATEDRETQRQDGVLIAFAVGAAKKIWRGILGCTDNATLKAEPAADAAGKTFCGVSYEKADNSSGAAGAINCRFYQKGVFTFPYTGAAPALGAKVYVSDDQTVTATASVNPVAVGRVVKVDTTAVTCDIDIGRRD